MLLEWMKKHTEAIPLEPQDRQHEWTVKLQCAFMVAFTSCVEDGIVLGGLDVKVCSNARFEVGCGAEANLSSVILSVVR